MVAVATTRPLLLLLASPANSSSKLPKLIVVWPGKPPALLPLLLLLPPLLWMRLLLPGLLPLLLLSSVSTSSTTKHTNLRVRRHLDSCRLQHTHKTIRVQQRDPSCWQAGGFLLPCDLGPHTLVGKQRLPFCPTHSWSGPSVGHTVGWLRAIASCARSSAASRVMRYARAASAACG